jgi:hypothetical protein
MARSEGKGKGRPRGFYRMPRGVFDRGKRSGRRRWVG